MTKKNSLRVARLRWPIIHSAEIERINREVLNLERIVPRRGAFLCRLKGPRLKRAGETFLAWASFWLAALCLAAWPLMIGQRINNGCRSPRTSSLPLHRPATRPLIVSGTIRWIINYLRRTRGSYANGIGRHCNVSSVCAAF
jgi:hypothetical protein